MAYTWKDAAWFAILTRASLHKMRDGYRRLNQTIDNAIDGCVSVLGCLIITIASLGFIATVLYGIVVIIFRSAFGVELPNPFE